MLTFRRPTCKTANNVGRVASCRYKLAFNTSDCLKSSHSRRYFTPAYLRAKVTYNAVSARNAGPFSGCTPFRDFSIRCELASRVGVINSSTPACFRRLRRSTFEALCVLQQAAATRYTTSRTSAGRRLGQAPGASIEDFISGAVAEAGIVRRLFSDAQRLQTNRQSGVAVDWRIIHAWPDGRLFMGLRRARVTATEHLLFHANMQNLR
jgi:hypothetical protein